MKRVLAIGLLFFILASPVLADSPKYDLATFGHYLVITEDKSFSPRRNMAIHKSSIIAVNRTDKQIRITTDILIAEYDRENEILIDTNQTYELIFSDDDEAEKLFFRLIELISN